MSVESKERRKALQLFGATSLFALAGGANSQQLCRNGGESTAGPYPDTVLRNRRDLRSNSTSTIPKPGAPLTLRVRVVDILNNCAPIKNAVVDIWSCDATGLYSGYSAFNTVGQDFCRGYQVTDANGVAEFVTLFPGSYTGRAIHIHAAVQNAARRVAPNASGRNLSSVFICQFYFARSVVDQVFNTNPIYRRGAPITPNENDFIYRNEGGPSYLTNVVASGGGYLGNVQIGTTRAGVGNPV